MQLSINYNGEWMAYEDVGNTLGQFMALPQLMWRALRQPSVAGADALGDRSARHAALCCVVPVSPVVFFACKFFYCSCVKTPTYVPPPSPTFFWAPHVRKQKLDLHTP